jgi:hypothetical protein
MERQLMTIGLDYITDHRAYGHSEAMQALHDHACNWLLTIDCLVYADGLTLAEAIKAADAGFRGDNVRAARRFLASLPSE